jgi:16S rRNA (adenine1518-N6/adenine1519-N6)-dimethyltransferase
MEAFFEHKKSLGQHFLNSDYAPHKLCLAANLQKGDMVLEIGPGTGALTKTLLLSGVSVIALEADQRAIEALTRTFQAEIATGQLHVIHHDVRSLDLAQFGLKDKQYKVVANIPYYLSGFLFRTLLTSPIQPSTVVFLVQKEVALRIARSKKESLLSLSVKIFGDPTYICTVSRSHFTPPPKVDSAIVAIHNISRSRLGGISEAAFFTLLHLGFGQKRKQLLGNLSEQYSRNHLEQCFSEIGLPLTVRAEDVALADWISLTEKLTSTDFSTS